MKIVKELMYEGGQLSFTRVLVALSFLLFVLGSAYLMLNGITWQHYDTFASLTGGGGIVAQVGNKFVLSKYGIADKTTQVGGETNGQIGNKAP